MAITEKKCGCGCGEKFYGTERREYFNNTCKNRDWRKKKKELECGVNDISETVTRKIRKDKANEKSDI